VPDPLPTPVTFDEIAPIIANNCGGARCHSAGARHANYVDNQTNVDSDRDLIVSEVSGGSMPPRDAMAAADRDLLLKYCTQ
jgi:hypothetical protein